MYIEQIEILNAWKDFLTEIETKMQVAIKKILNTSMGNKDIYAMFFEYQFDYMDIAFFAIDNKSNVLVRDLDTINNEINCKYLFPNELFDKQLEIIDKYEEEDDNFDDFTDEYYEKKEEIFKEWFILCWDKIKGEYNSIPSAFFSIHDTRYKINLDTKEEVTDDDIIK